MISCRKFCLRLIIRFISNANDTELNEMISAINQRYPHIHPEWDMVYLALPKHNPNEQERLLQKAFSIFTEEKQHKL